MNTKEDAICKQLQKKSQCEDILLPDIAKRDVDSIKYPSKIWIQRNM